MMPRRNNLAVSAQFDVTTPTSLNGGCDLLKRNDRSGDTANIGDPETIIFSQFKATLSDGLNKCAL